MAFSPSGDSNGIGRRGRGRFQHGGAISDINVTPFVDVLLVLLVIFMLTAHVMESGIEVDVPAVKTTKDANKDLPVIAISKDGSFYLGDDPININLIVPTLRKRYTGQAVYVRADKAVPWEIVAQVMAELGAAKMGVNMVTKPEDITRRQR